MATKHLGDWMKRMSAKTGDAARELAGYPNVACVTLGEKRLSGNRTGTPALIVYVLNKGAVGGAYAIPKQMKVRIGPRRSVSIDTDVVELRSRPRTLGARGGDIVHSGDRQFGTGTFAFVKHGRGYIATNAHVIANVLLRKIFGQPMLQDPATFNSLPIGPVVYSSLFNPGAFTDEDYAVLSTRDIPVDHMAILGEASPISRFGDFSSDPNAQYWYASNGGKIRCSFAEMAPLDVDTLIFVDDIFYPYRNFWALQVNGGVPADGHSGAIVCRGSGDDIVACGILFAGAPPNFAYVFPIEPIFTRVYEGL